MREFRHHLRAEQSWLKQVLATENPAPGEARVQLVLRGNTKSLNAAKKLLEEAGALTPGETEADIRQGKTGLEMKISFNAPDTSPEAALRRVHSITHCNIGAYIHPDTVDYDSQTGKGETHSRYIPGVRVTFDAPTCETTHELVKQYMLNRIREHYHHQYLYGGVGQTGLPLQYEGHWQGDDKETLSTDTIYAHFRDRSTSNANRAKLLSLGICEHLSGVLGIHEVTRTPHTGGVGRYPALRRANSATHAPAAHSR